MNDITKRFISIYEYLIKNKFVADKLQFSKQIGVSNSLLTELSSNRCEVGRKPLQNTISRFNINPEWLFFGKGEMFADENTDNSISIVSEPAENYETDIFTQLKNRFAIIERKLSIMQSDIEELKKQIRK